MRRASYELGLWRAALLAVAAVLVAGCASPAWRIKRNPDVFAAFPPEVQQNVRQGRIELGYTHDMVFIALGRPHCVYDRVSGEGNREIWSYSGATYRTGFVPVDASYWYVDRRGDVRLAYGWSWVDVGYRGEIETLRIEFEKDAVEAIESLRR